jgi:hypothetical protein
MRGSRRTATNFVNRILFKTLSTDIGDAYHYTANSYSNMQDLTFTGTVIRNDGTGRFEGRSGEVTMIGVQSPTGAIWHAEGYMIMAKK